MNPTVSSLKRGFLAALSAGFVVSAAAQSGVLREYYPGISGTAVADLTNNASYPNNPSTVTVLTNFEAPTDVDDYYGQRLRAYIIASQTGSYTFWIASDDNSALYLSADDAPSNAVQIASVSSWTGSEEWTKFTEQTSAQISLTAGKKYFIEALMKEGSGGDNLAVGWQLPDGTYERPVPGSRLLVYGAGAPLITAQPANVTVIEGGAAQFSVGLDFSYGAALQWKRGGTNMPGETNTSYMLWPATMRDNGAVFQCAITNSYGSAVSSNATLTVTPDTTPPTLVSASYLGNNTLLSVIFSEPVQAASALAAANYSIAGLTVNSVTWGPDSRTVLLRTTAMTQGASYTLVVNNVKDCAATPNVIAANSSLSFKVDFTPLDIAALSPSREALGPSSRRTGLAFSEIMFHPPDRADGKVLEFIELHNSQAYAVDLSGFRLSGDVNYTIPTNTVIPMGGYLVLAPVPADVMAVYGISGVLGPFTNLTSDGVLTTNRLSNGSGTVRLRNSHGAVFLEANFSGDSPWPVAADGGGHSLVLARPSYGEANPLAWEASDLVGGTPGAAETPGSNPYRTIVINEFLAHTDPPDVDYIELYNYGTNTVDLSGCSLSDKVNTNRFIIANTTIAPKGFVVFTEMQMGFALSAAGETVWLRNPSGNRVIDVVRFKAQENGVSTGRYPDGAPDFYRLQGKTPGAANAAIRISPVVINEIMYKPPTGGSDLEYVELFNHTSAAVNIGGWRLTDAVSFTFPTNTVIPAGGYIVAANKSALLFSNYPNLSAANTFGNYSGSLASGARLGLTMPDTIVSTNGTTSTTNTIHIGMDEVTYGTGGRWGQWADGGGSSLELVDWHADHRQAPNWADSDETSKSPWTNIEFTGTLDNGDSSVPIDSVHIMLEGPGECLIDNVEVVVNGVNVVANPTLDSSTNNWFFQGTHDQSYWQSSGGYGGGGCIHAVATERGDPGANRIRASLNTTLSSGTTATLRAKVRWLKGDPEILIRLRGNWLEAYGNILGSKTLGTPGAANSRAVANAGPSIWGVTHSPVLPADGQDVTVTAHVSDPDGLGSLILKYRLDPATNLISAGMKYAGAGVYTATIPGQAAGVIAAFFIQAQDSAANPATTLFPNDAPNRECLVRFGENEPSTGLIGTYHFWITQKTNNRWTTREKNSNEPLDATFVNGNRVIYNIGALYSGSPWHTPGYSGPTSAICDYILDFPDDDLFLGASSCILASLGNLNNDDTGMREKMAFWTLGQLGCPTLYRRDINLLVNGQLRGLVYEDAQQPGSDTIAENFPDDNDGDLHKIEDWFEFDNSGDVVANHTDASLALFTTTGGSKKLARYRWNWRKRAVKTSANDYTSFFKLVDAMNQTLPDPYDAQIQRVADIDSWTRLMALNHSVGNWDSYGYQRGKNMFTYKPQNDKWKLIGWDIDFVWDLGDAATNDMNPATMTCNDSVARQFLTYPVVQRSWWRALQDLANGPLADAQFQAHSDSIYQGFAIAGISTVYPTAINTYAATRRAYILNLLATNVPATFTVNAVAASTGSNTLTLTGTAPISVATITINGIAYPVKWTSVSNWTATVALQSGANTLAIAGLDSSGQTVANASATNHITYTGAADQPKGHVVINEIMYNPVAANASYVELYNASPTNAFDLSGYELHGADFTFPNGSVIAPKGFSVIAQDGDGFVAAYGAGIPVAGYYSGTLQNSGETLELIKPATATNAEIIVNEVTYDSAAPWPTNANGFGPSLQLIDAAQDNNRVCNWAAVSANTVSTPAPQWQYVTATGTASTSRLYLYLNAAGDVYIDDIQLVAGSVAATGSNYVRNGGFESALTTSSWNTTANTASTAIATNAAHSGNSSLHLVCNAAGSSVGDCVWQDVNVLVTNAQYTVSFWYLQPTNSERLMVRLSGNGISNLTTLSTASTASTTLLTATPGASNSVAASLPAFPLVWLNEIQTGNASGAKDNAGDRDSWVEIYNSGTNAVNLTGYYLSDTDTNRQKWAFPSGTTLGAGQFRVVWLDNETNETSGTNLHASFKALATNGLILLTKGGTNAVTTNVVDYLSYDLMNNDRSFGAYPDGTPTKRRLFYYATPGAANNNAWPSNSVLINEWMASNTKTITNSATNKFSDWFELYNPSPSNVDLSGYYMANSLTNKTQFHIPNGYFVPANGYLLVWADGNSSFNKTNDANLHVNFKLSASGEIIALFTPQGVLVDGITFTAQTDDISQGRWPDGNSGQYYFMVTPTPGAANIVGVPTNHPPVMPVIADQTVYQQSPLLLTVAATDPDAGQTLTYSLDDGAPLSSQINASSGVFSWTPTQADPPADYTVTIRATDDGIPPASATCSVKITVRAQVPLRFNPPTMDASGNFTFSWPTQPGLTYRISCKNDLSETNWTVLTSKSGTGADLSFSDAIQPTATRFYRIELISQ